MTLDRLFCVGTALSIYGLRVGLLGFETGAQIKEDAKVPLPLPQRSPKRVATHVARPRHLLGLSQKCEPEILKDALTANNRRPESLTLLAVPSRALAPVA